MYLNLYVSRTFGTKECLKWFSSSLTPVYFSAASPVGGYYYLDANCNSANNVGEKFAKTPEECADLCDTLTACIGERYDIYLLFERSIKY